MDNVTVVFTLLRWLQLACFAMSIYIGVGWQGALPGWVIAMYVAHAVLFPACIYAQRSIDSHSVVMLRAIAVLLGTIPWAITAIMIAAATISCDPSSDFFRSLIPGYPYQGTSAEYVAHVKCVFTGFQLAFGGLNILLIAVLGGFGLIIGALAILERILTPTPAPNKGVEKGATIELSQLEKQEVKREEDVCATS